MLFFNEFMKYECVVFNFVENKQPFR